MASYIEIGTGPISARIDWANDTKVQATLLRIYEINGLGPSDATPAQKLNAVLLFMVREARRTLLSYEINDRQESLVTAINSDYGFE